MLEKSAPPSSSCSLLTLITGLAYPLAMTAHRRRDLPEAGARQPDREGRQGGRLRPDRAGVQGRQIFPRPPLGDAGAGPGRFHQDGAGALQRRQFRRLQPRPDQQGAERPGQGRCRQVEGRESRPRPCRSIWSPRPAAASIPTSRRKRAVPGAAGRQGAQHAGRSASAQLVDRATPRAALPACSASRGSTCWR